MHQTTITYLTFDLLHIVFSSYTPIEEPYTMEKLEETKEPFTPTLVGTLCGQSVEHKNLWCTKSA